MPSLNTNVSSSRAESLVSPLVTTRPELTISAASINSEPVELDSTPASPQTGRDRRGSRAGMLETLTPEARQKREELIAERKEDPAVMADIPQEPTADELEKSGASTENTEAQSQSSNK